MSRKIVLVAVLVVLAPTAAAEAFQWGSLPKTQSKAPSATGSQYGSYRGGLSSGSLYGSTRKPYGATGSSYGGYRGTPYTPTFGPTVTRFNDRNGTYQGRAVTEKSGRTVYYDRYGRSLGTSNVGKFQFGSSY